MIGTRFTLEIQPTIPERLKRLEELANDLLYSWDRQVRSLFFRLDRELWEACGHNPKVFLRRVSQEKLEQALEDHLPERHKWLLPANNAALQEGAHFVQTMLPLASP